MLPHPKYCKRLVGGCGKEKKGEKKNKKRKKEGREKKSGIMIK